VLCSKSVQKFTKSQKSGWSGRSTWGATARLPRQKKPQHHSEKV
jgi:hypothetical protein